MDSASHRLQQEQKRKEEIAKKIAALQAELAELPTETTITKPAPSSPKRKREPPKTLVPATPSPRKKRKVDNPPRNQQPVPQPSFKRAPPLHGTNATRKPSTSTPNLPSSSLKPSNVLANLANIKTDPVEEAPVETTPRTTSFTDRAAAGQEHRTSKRDETLAIIENLQPGPYEHNPPLDDPKFEKLEPHSNIALKSRSLPHEDFSAHLEGRYFLSPSQLYSCIRLQPDKQHYDVPVPGDWVTVAVVAERGPIKYTRAPVALEGDGAPNDRWKNKKEEKDKSKPSGRKYTNIKLIDFGARSKSSATGGKAVVRGDAFLSLLLFESESVELHEHPGGGKPQKVYRGGSKGAFESLEKLKEGDVIALLNPRILKPYQKSGDQPHPVNNILAITPESASSIAILGRARDLGMCAVKKKDGSTCGSWVDKRQSDVCEYHIQNAVQHRRAARPEFSASTGGMSTSAAVKRKTDYDPARQWGLQPSTSVGEGSTYIISGHIVRGGSQSSLFNPENIGREGQAKAKRKLAGDEEKQLKKMLERDRDGMQAVLKAREAVVQAKAAASEDVKGKARAVGQGKKGKKSIDDSAVAELNKPKKAYSANVIRSLGFDPTLKPGHRRGEVTDDSMSKREQLAALCSSRKEIKLGPAPGPKKRSNIVAPAKTTSSAEGGEHDSPPPPPSPAPGPADDDGMIDLDDF